MLMMLMSSLLIKNGDDDDEDEYEDCGQAVMTWVGRSVRALETLLRPICSNQRWAPSLWGPSAVCKYLESTQVIPGKFRRHT